MAHNGTSKFESEACEECGEKMKGKNQGDAAHKLKAHKKTHGEVERNFKCEEIDPETGKPCGMAYIEQRHLNEHHREKHQEGGKKGHHCPHAPDACDDNHEKGFGKKATLREHIWLKHDKIKWPCTVPDCGRAGEDGLSEECALKRHLKSCRPSPFSLITFSLCPKMLC